MKKKKGFLLASETVKIVIALIAITFLIYLLTSIYLNKIKDEKKTQADNFLTLSSNSFEDLVSLVREDGTPRDISVPNPVGWYVFSFTGDKKPKNCFGQNCICICDNVINWFWINRQEGECTKDGICLPIKDMKRPSKELELKITSKKDGLLFLAVSKIDNKIEVKKK